MVSLKSRPSRRLDSSIARRPGPEMTQASDPCEMAAGQGRRRRTPSPRFLFCCLELALAKKGNSRFDPCCPAPTSAVTGLGAGISETRRDCPEHDDSGTGPWELVGAKH
ncbi:hypothetical protein EDB80DRAFT_685487 [Ilyonectria destructans]|nr:hypothetical protein EDB80DRAFT_685487 [Ilyonectria destructans]